jgi:hypothetical protein
LFNACSTYSQQSSKGKFSEEGWYENLKPVISLQILDYDTNRITGIKDIVADNLVDRVKKNPQLEDQSIKHFLLTDWKSKRVINHFQLVQVELPRAEKSRKLFPPEVDFTDFEWWISIFRHANDYTDEVIKKFERIMPEPIVKASKRLDLRVWNSKTFSEYMESFLNRRDLYEAICMKRVTLLNVQKVSKKVSKKV